MNPNIILDLAQKEVEDLIYMIKSMPSQPEFLASIEAQLASQLAEEAPVEDVVATPKKKK
jgi:hypothetical protein